MFVRCKRRFKDGKEHRYWSLVETVRVRGGRVVQRHVLYLGEINDSQRAAWCRSIEVVEGKSGSRQMALFPEDREAPALNCEVVKIDVAEVALHDPRQWGACWLALVLWDRLDLDRFWGPRLTPSRQGTRRLDIKTNRASRALHRRCGEGTPPPRPPKRATPCSARTTLLLMRPRPFRRGRRGRARPATAASTCRRPGRRWTPPPSKICAAGPTPRSPPPSWRASPAGPSRARSFRPSRAESVPFRRLVRLSAASRARPRP